MYYILSLRLPVLLRRHANFTQNTKLSYRRGTGLYYVTLCKVCTIQNRVNWRIPKHEMQVRH